MPNMRLDFIFTSSNLIHHPEDDEKQFINKQVNKHKGNLKKLSQTIEKSRLIAAGVERSDLTKKLSDHFPVYLSWYEDIDPFGN